jgi:hypothetical protein
MVSVEVRQMATREDLDGWLVDAIAALGGTASIVDACKMIWEEHEDELKGSGSLFYTWQYDVRWAANRLRRKKIMRSVEESPPHVWELVTSSAARAAS